MAQQARAPEMHSTATPLPITHACATKPSPFGGSVPQSGLVFVAIAEELFSDSVQPMCVRVDFYLAVAGPFLLLARYFPVRVHCFLFAFRLFSGYLRVAIRLLSG
jgi:hypothetical protein